MNIVEKLFGFALRSTDKEQKVKTGLKSFIPPNMKDGAITIDQQPFGYGGYFYSTPYQANRLANEFELITKYRQMALHPIVAKAIEEICNEAVVADDAGSYKLEINLDEIESIDDESKEKIIKVFDQLLKMCNYTSEAYNLFRQWYIDGRMFSAVLVDDEKLSEGIKDIRTFDPRQIQLVRNITRDSQSTAQLAADGIASGGLARLIDDVEEFFVYNPYGIYSTYVNSAENITGVKIETDAVSYITSGLMDAENQIVISFLEQASKVLNQLSDLEDSMVIYRMSRSTEKRVFYVGVGKMSHAKSSAYIKGIAEKYKTKIVYDPTTGRVDIGNNQRSLVEDYFVPVRENDGTKIETLQAGQALDSIPDLEYFWKLLTKSLNVPATRLQESSAYSIGKSSEITRDEISFKKFITRLQLKFGEHFLHLLKIELELRGIMSGEEFDKIKQDIALKFATDNFFYEMKEAEILSIRATTANDIGSANEVHQIFSSRWVKQHIFKLTDEEIAQNDKEIKQERLLRAQLGIEQPEDHDEKGGSATKPATQADLIDDIEKSDAVAEDSQDNDTIKQKDEKHPDVSESLDILAKYVSHNRDRVEDDIKESIDILSKYVKPTDK